MKRDVLHSGLPVEWFAAHGNGLGRKSGAERCDGAIERHLPLGD